MIDITQPPLNSPIQTKIAWAENRYVRGKEELFKNQELVQLLESLKTAAHTSRREMMKTGIITYCRKCDEQEGGSCCGAGLENYYSGMTLLVNRLLGVILPQEKGNPADCYFLSRSGCLLLAREVICINYLCDTISKEVKPELLLELREAEGNEILLMLQSKELIKKMIER